jgi:hypothetical protein
MLRHTTSHQSARGLAAASRALLVSIEPLLKWFSRRCLVKASMPSRCSQRSPTASCRKSLRCAPTGSLLARRSASAACCSNADSSRFTCGPNKLIFVAWRKIDLYPTSRARFVKWFTIHLRPDCELSPALRNGALGRACFLVLLFLAQQPTSAFGPKPQTSDCGCLIFLIHASCDDPDRIVGQWPLQRLGLIPWRASFGAGKSAVSSHFG